MDKLSAKIKQFLKKIGPGFITGAADDDPSGVATYSITGAQFGYKMSWLTLFVFPMMVTIQEMCGKIGMLSGTGLAGLIKKHYSKRLLILATVLLTIANTINIGADLGIMAASMQMLLGFPLWYWLIIVALFVTWMEIAISYKVYSNALKWLGLSLCVYVITAFMVKQDWSQIAMSFILPKMEFTNMDYLMTMVAFLGTTISPYLFFWQPSEEVEEEINEGKIKDFGFKPKTTEADMKAMKFDTRVGMFFSNLMAFFIIITTAATLNASGITNIETAQQAAMALKPLAGDMAYLLFSVGIIGIGLQAIPVLAGSLSYAISESFGLKEGLSKDFKDAKGFYLIIAASTIVGVLMNFIGIDTMKALYYSAIINGIVAVPLIAIIIKLSDNEKVVGKHKNTNVARAIGWSTFCFMFIAVILMVVNIAKTII